MKKRRAAGFFWEFFKIGFCTFGGGWSIVAQIEKQYVRGQQLLTSQELLDLTSVGRSLPGVMITNVSFLFGYQVGGWPADLPVCWASRRRRFSFCRQSRWGIRPCRATP